MQRYPQPGCIVEYMEGNVPQIAMVLEGDENRLRLLLPNRREAKLSSSRVLPGLAHVLIRQPAGTTASGF